MNGLQQEYNSRMNFTLVDIDLPESRALKQQYGFRAQPYFVLLDGDESIVKTWYGLVAADEFRQAFDALVGG